MEDSDFIELGASSHSMDHNLDVGRIKEKAGIKKSGQSVGDGKNHFRKQVYPFQISWTSSNITFTP